MYLHSPIVLILDRLEERDLTQVGLDDYLVAWLEVKLEEMLLRLLRDERFGTSLFHHFQEVGILLVLQSLLILIIYDLLEDVDLLGLRLLRDVLHNRLVRLRLL